VCTGLALLSGCAAATPVHISVDHPVALWDQPLRITVSGLRPYERAVLRATSSDQAGRKFASSTPVTADAHGRIRLSGDAAVRVLWSLRLLGLPAGVDFGYDIPRSGATITLRVSAARTTIRRLTVAQGVHVVRVRHLFVGEFFSPARTGARRPGVLVFGGSEGGLSTTGLAALYASHGYPSLALAYFGAPGLPRNLVRIPLEYFARALRWLRRQPGVDPSKLAVEGISRGSEATQLLGIHYPQLVHAVIAMVPSNGAVCGIARASCSGPAWTLYGKAIPYAVVGSQYTPYPFPDERIRGPIFLDCAGADELWPSCPMAQANRIPPTRASLPAQSDVPRLPGGRTCGRFPLPEPGLPLRTSRRAVRRLQRPGDRNGMA
jgi:dienelactone hydrolase